MNLKDIKINGDGKNLEKITRAIKSLPEEAIQGISGYGWFTASMEGEEVVMVSTSDTSRDDIKVEIPKRVSNLYCFRNGRTSWVSFRYNGTNYRIGF